MTKSKGIERQPTSYPAFMVGLTLTVGLLYLAKPVIVPLALSVLMTFILAPVVGFVQRRGIGRVPATLVVVAVAFLIAGVIGWGVGAQVSKLANDLPQHTTEIRNKVNRLRSTGGPIAKLSKMFADVGSGPTTAASTQPSALSKQPGQPVVVTAVGETSNSAMQRLLNVSGVILEPAATAGLVLILVIFMLIRREDLRNRVVGLLGPARLTGTTRVTVEAGRRLSKFLLAQLGVNATFGVLFGLGLLILGVPYWFLWGFLTAVLRFVPYIGTWASVLFPLTLSFATSPGWAQPIELMVFFVILDLVTANVVEPLLFGHSTGVSPVALLVAAAFWTWIWGPVGLILSTPLTVCMVVLGQHAPRLRALSLLLGDQPALDPHVNFYQRLLAGDQHEAADVLKSHRSEKDAIQSFDLVVIPALRLMRRDRSMARLEIDDERFFIETTDTLLKQNPTLSRSVDEAPLVLASPSHHRSEELVLQMLGLSLGDMPVRFEATSTQALAVEVEQKIDSETPSVWVVAVLPPGGLVQAKYLCRRLRARFPELKIIVLYLGKARSFDQLLVRLRKCGASYVTTSIAQTKSQVKALLESASPTTNVPGR